MSDNWENERSSYSVKKKEYKDPKKGYESKETVKTILLSYKAVDWGDRGLRKETLETFGVLCKVSTEIGPTVVEKVYFPYYSQEDKLCGYKVKNFLKDKHEKGHFYTVGHVGVDCQLFGQRECKGPTQNLKIVEGEIDQLSAYQALLDRQLSDETPEKYRKLKPQIVSIGCGTVHARDHIGNNSEFTDNYNNIWLAFDNDQLSDLEKQKRNPGMKGKECTESVGAFLCTAKQSGEIYIIQWPDYFNDCSDALQKGKSEELARILLFDKKKFKVEKIVSLYEVFKPGELKDPIPKGVYLPSYPKLMDKLMGDRQGELTLLLAPSGAGKSTITADMLYEYIVEEGYGGGIFLEENLKKTFQRFIARKMGINLKNFRLGMVDIDNDKYIKAEKWVADPDNFLALDHSGSIKISELDSLARIMVRKHKRKKIIFDHLTLATSDSKTGQEERLKLDESMKMLAALCEQEDASITVVCHVNRGVQLNRKREFEEPYWKRCFKEDARGSSAIECLSWNVICLDIEELPSQSRGRVRLSLQKNREASETGFTDCLIMDQKSGKMIDASNWVYSKSRGIILPAGEDDGY